MEPTLAGTGRTSGRIDVSVVVCTYNRSHLLEAALSSLVSLCGGESLRHEILIVDNHSTDATQEIIETFARGPESRVRIAVEAAPGIAHARNRGIRDALGDWIAFFDDDQIADENWLQSLLGTATSMSAPVVLGARQLLLAEHDLNRLPRLCRQILGEYMVSDQPFQYRGAITGSTGNLLVHRSVFDAVGRFDEESATGGEDFDLFRRIRGARLKAWYDPGAIVHHIVPQYRLMDDYFRWTCLRHGVHLAKRERHTWGKLGYPLTVLARLAQAGGLFVPQLVLALVRGAPQHRLKACCDLWRAEGCLRTAGRVIAPSALAQREFFHRLDFRTERGTFASCNAELPNADER